LTCSLIYEDIAAIESLWINLLEKQPNSAIFLTPEWQHIWWKIFGTSDKELRLFLVGDSAQPIGLAPMMKEGDTLKFLGDTDLFDYHDFILGNSDPAVFYPLLTQCLNLEAWRDIHLKSIEEHSPALKYLPDLFRLDGYRVTVSKEDSVPGLYLPKSWDDYLQLLSKKDRHELRRKFRRLSTIGEFSLVESGLEDLGDNLERFIQMMTESREDKRDFMLPEREAFFRSMALVMKQAAYLRLMFLELDGEKIAGIVCFDYANTRFLYNSGYRLEYKRYSVGLLLKALCINDAIEADLNYFDFLRGSEPYKYDLGAQDSSLYSIIVER
jgi:CelD/BcsL family acetyltransferase involved in cellulose biosynthesis